MRTGRVRGFSFCNHKFHVGLVVLGLALVSSDAFAARQINWVELNGGAQWTFNSGGGLISAGDPVTVNRGETVTVTMNVTTTGGGSGNDWESTAWRISATPPGSFSCANTPNHSSAGTYTETFEIFTEAVLGTLNGYFRVHNGNSCGSTSPSPTVTLANAITVEEAEPNPPLAEACGLDLVLVVDTSGSIGSDMGTVRDAAKDFVDAFLPGTPTRIGLVHFATSSTIDSGLSNDATALKNIIDTYSSSGYTNWEEAIEDATSILEGGGDRDDDDHPDLIVVFTDGDPTISSAGSSTTSQPNIHLSPAVAAAEAAKTSSSTNPIRIITVGVSGATTSRLIAISGPNVSPPSPIDETVDVILGSFATLAETLGDLAIGLCGGTVTVQKIIDQDGNLGTTGDQSNGEGWTFTINVDPPDSATPGSGMTDVDGQITFDVDLGGDLQATVAVTETLQSGYNLISAMCTSNNGGKGIPSGNSVTNISVNDEDIISCTFYNGPDLGACCNQNVPGGECTENVTESSCDGSGFVWTGAALCSQVNCCSSDAQCTDNDKCTIDACEPGMGCTHTPVDCNDGNPCTNDTCHPVAGCQNLPKNCSDGVACTVDSCNPANGNCQHAPTDALCDNGDYCDGSETCDLVNGCQSGTAPDCSDGIDCTTDSCDEVNDTCQNTPSNAFCNDGVPCTTDACVVQNENICLDFETEDDFLTALVNGQKIDVGGEFGVLVNISSLDPFGSNHRGPAIFNSTPCPAGPNCGGGDEDLLVGLGNLLMLQNATVGTLAGDIFSPPDDEAGGGTIVIDILVPNATMSSIDLVDINGGSPVSVVLTDGSANTRTYSVPEKWTRDIDADGPDGYKTLDLTTLANQPGEAVSGGPFDATASEDPGFNSGDVVKVAVTLHGSGAIDNLKFSTSTGGCVNTPVDDVCDDNAHCNGVETCDPVNGCQAGTPPDCDDGVSCTNDSCNESTDSCDNIPSNGLCSDGQYCNGVETCDPINGCQSGTPVNCDDGIPCTIDACDEVNDVCTHTPDSGACSDGQYCNGNEICVLNVGCQAGTPPNCNDGVACTVDSCDEANDVCVNAPSDALCDDSAFCNGAETCDPVNGCEAGTPPNCNDGVGCTADSCDEVNDVCVNAPNDGACNDSQFCNGVETCDPINDCQAGTPPNCNDGVGCTNDSCDEVNDVCVNAPSNALCTDGQYCNGAESCDPINDCQAGTPPNCDDGVGCTTDSCDEINDVCVNAPVDAACDDSQYCNGTETCDPDNDCQAGTPPNCNDGVACTVDSCDETNDVCVNQPSDALCSDSQYCNGDETCDPVNGCQAGTPPNCGDGVPCTVDTCDEVNDVCVNTPNDAACNDSQYCNGVETCDPLNGCEAGTPPDCNDGVVCTNDSCDEVNDVCVNQPNNSLCNNGMWCDGMEFCDPINGCQNGTPPNCDDGVDCTDDSCDEMNDVCVNDPNDDNCDDLLFCNGMETCDPVNGCQPGTDPCPPGLFCDEVNDECVDCLVDADCNDNLYCNGTETCVGGACVPGTPPNCNDGVSCTVDSCDEVNDVCVNTPTNSLCNDGDHCNGVETCDPINDCQAGTPPNCDDGVSCTVDSCDEINDVCVNQPTDSLCNDGEHCNGVETCDPLNDCQAGTPPNCDDGVSCTTDTCNEITDSCDHAPVDSVCDDLQFCNGVETCDPLDDCQAGTPPNCGDGIGCTVDSCDEVNDVCVNDPDDAACDDLQFCNGVETCDPVNGCQAGTPPNCDDGVSCTIDNCNEATDMCTHTPKNGLCSNGLFCDGSEVCDPINDCQPGTPPNCDDGVACTVDDCDENADICVNTPNSGLCDNGLFCDGSEVCDPLNGCVGGTPPNCNDGVSCTVDGCDEVNDVCTNQPSDAICDDSLFCNGVELCDPLNDCQAGTPPNCGDGVGCTIDSCDEVNDVCVNAPNDAACSDSQFCNGVETCDPVNGCQAGTPPDCDDGVNCTIDTCNEQTDQCDHALDHPFCSDGQFCNGLEICHPTNDCVAGTPPDCDDGVDCTDDICNEQTDQCDNTPNDSNCNDGQFCNGVETCDRNNDCQAGTPPNCNDGVTCTIDSCNEQTDQCDHQADDAACNDGQFCNGVETCDPASGCDAGTPPDCTDSVACTIDSCDENNDICRNLLNNMACSDGDDCTEDACTLGGCVSEKICGACCLIGGGCQEFLSEEECDALGNGIFLGVGMNCLDDADGDGFDDACPIVVPTVSEWGLVVLTLLLCIGAKLYFGRREVLAA